MTHRANTRNGCIIQQPYTWKQEFGAWLLVMLTILGLWLLYQYFETDASSAPTYHQRKVQV